MKKLPGQDLATSSTQKIIQNQKVWWNSCLLNSSPWRGLSPRIWGWPRAKIIYKMLPWPTNMFRRRRKNITCVKIDSWPRFGHIFVHSTISKLPKILWKWRISMESQAQSKSYLKSLAKGQHEMKKQSFWPKNVILACGKSRPRKTWTHCKNLFNRGYQRYNNSFTFRRNHHHSNCSSW